MAGIDIARTVVALAMCSALLVFIVAVVRLAMKPMPPGWQHPNVPPAMLPPMPKPPSKRCGIVPWTHRGSDGSIHNGNDPSGMEH